MKNTNYETWLEEKRYNEKRKGWLVAIIDSIQDLIMPLGWRETREPIRIEMDYTKRPGWCKATKIWCNNRTGQIVKRTEWIKEDEAEYWDCPEYTEED